jgi:hypothetical protein
MCVPTPAGGIGVVLRDAETTILGCVPGHPCRDETKDFPAPVCISAVSPSNRHETATSRTVRNATSNDRTYSKSLFEYEKFSIPVY